MVDEIIAQLIFKIHRFKSDKGDKLKIIINLSKHSANLLNWYTAYDYQRKNHIQL